MGLSLLLAIKERLSFTEHSQENAFFDSLSDTVVALLCDKLIYFNIFHISLTLKWDGVFQQDGVSMTNRWAIVSQSLLVCVSEVALSPFWLNLSLGAHAQVQQAPISPPVSPFLQQSCIFFCLLFIPRHAILHLAISKQIFCVWFTDHSRALCACLLN